MEKVRTLIDVDDRSIQIVEKEAKKQKRSLKSFLGAHHRRDRYSLGFTFKRVQGNDG